MLSALAAASLADGVFGLSGSLPASMALRNAKICEPCVGSGLPPKDLMGGDVPGARRTDPIPPPGTETCKWGPTAQKSLVSVCSYDGKTKAVKYPNALGPFQLNFVRTDQTKVNIALQIKEEYRPWIEFCHLVLRVLYGGDVTRETVIGGSSSSEWNTKGVVVEVDPAKETVKITENGVSGIVRGDWKDECPDNTFMPNRHGFEVIKNITEEVFKLNKELDISLKYGAVAKTLSVTINNYTAVLSGFKNFRMIQWYGLSECWSSNISVTQANCDSAKSDNETSVDSNSTKSTSDALSSQSCNKKVVLKQGCVFWPAGEDFKVSFNPELGGNFSGDLTRKDLFGVSGSLYKKVTEENVNITTTLKIKNVLKGISSCGLNIVVTDLKFKLSSSTGPSDHVVSPYSTFPTPVVSVNYASRGDISARLSLGELPLYPGSEKCPADQRPIIISDSRPIENALCEIPVSKGDTITVTHRSINRTLYVGLELQTGASCWVEVVGMKGLNSFNIVPEKNSYAVRFANLCFDSFTIKQVRNDSSCNAGDPPQANYVVDLTEPRNNNSNEKLPDDGAGEQSAWNDISEFIKENVVLVTIIGSILGVAVLSALYFCLLYRQSRENVEGEEMQPVEPGNQGGQTDQLRGDNGAAGGRGASTGHQTPDIQPVVARNQGGQTGQEIADLGGPTVVDTPQGPGQTDPTSLTQNQAIEAAGPQGGGNGGGEGAIQMSILPPIRGQYSGDPDPSAENGAIISSTLEFCNEAGEEGSPARSQASSGGIVGLQII